jgi:hypothetical protein
VKIEEVKTTTIVIERASAIVTGRTSAGAWTSGTKFGLSASARESRPWIDPFIGANAQSTADTTLIHCTCADQP